MARCPRIAPVARRASQPSQAIRAALLAVALLSACAGSALAQNLDCTALRAKIAALDSGAAGQPNRYATAARKQRAELDRTVAYARSLRCDQPEIPIFGPPLPPQCRRLNAKIAQMQANLGQLQAAATADGDSARQDLIARYDAYCRGSGPARQPQDPVTDFFETLFKGFAPPNPHMQPSAPWSPPMDESPDVEPDPTPRGGALAVCVRSCDGGYFPLHVSARGADPSYLANMCRALCPNAEVFVYTKPQSGDIEQAVSIDDGTVYSDLPNASKFRASYDEACSCKPPRRSWVEALAGAEQILEEGRSGDILVTPEAAAQLSQVVPERSAKKSSGTPAGELGAGPADRAAQSRAAAPERAADTTKEVVGPDGVKRRVRIIAPLL